MLLELWLAWTEEEQDSVHKVAEQEESSEEEEVHLSAERGTEDSNPSDDDVPQLPETSAAVLPSEPEISDRSSLP